jgi:hypothetical protein
VEKQAERPAAAQEVTDMTAAVGDPDLSSLRLEPGPSSVMHMPHRHTAAAPRMEQRITTDTAAVQQGLANVSEAADLSKMGTSRGGHYGDRSKL